MPHQVHQRKFGREGAHRRSMLRNLTLAVLRYERVKTTEARAKEIRRFVDRLIGLGKDGSLAARRRAGAFLPEPEIVEKVFSDLPKRFADRSSGYTRLVRLGHRVGDSAPMMLIELMPGVDETPPAEAAGEQPKRRGLRLPRRAKSTEASTEPDTATKTAARKGPATKRKAAKGSGREA